MIESISAVTFATHDMHRAVQFYRMLGFELISGGETAAFTSFRAGPNFVNLIAQPARAALVMVGPGDILRIGR
jgi:catechol-2,3-dioxygenase